MMMSRKITPHLVCAVITFSLSLGLINIAQAATGNIDPTHKWAWGSTIGWLNFNPTHGGVTVYADHLEGYAWAENIGWIKLGTHTGGGSHTYANTTADNYGVNRDSSGQLSGYAWSTTAGWINFNPSHSQVIIDPVSGSFDGYAWAENMGWIHFKGEGYNVVTNFGSNEAANQIVYLPLILR
jgi:hypothetical protein